MRDGEGTPSNGVPHRHQPDEPLTQREREVVRMMAGGYSNREIGGALGVAERTVKNHVYSILASSACAIAPAPCRRRSRSGCSSRRLDGASTAGGAHHPGKTSPEGQM